ncbi:MAG: hypothetical protein BWY95_01026 [Bacteroidetes bacterium ADurb.BinA104]|nr:MAG: hypothetical protein BWY95_01026 [Bacteroidetes bacterium ADurb.BinA104]
MRKWEEITLDGSEHYKGDVQLIDLFRHMRPHSSLTVVEIKGLSDIMKYAYRQLKRGLKDTDLEKIIHYAEIVGAANAESDEK